jgi:Rap1a immunity proteins
MRISVVFIGFCLLCSGPSNAQENVASANFQLPGCRELVFSHISGETAFRAGWCVGAVAAILSIYPSVCGPRGVTPEQAARVVISYLETKPARLHESFYKLTVEALSKAWPCDK